MGKVKPELSKKDDTVRFVEEIGILKRVTAMLHSNSLVNLLVCLALVIGFFHGWLKINYKHFIVTFLFDIVLLLALTCLYFSHSEKKESFLPDSPITKALMSFYILCGVYCILPFGPPLIISIASARGWCFGSLMFILGYHITKDVKQLRAYFYLTIILGVITAIYGIRQDPEQILEMMKTDKVFADRYANQFYTTSAGAEMRRFSTFVSSAGFGTTMAFVVAFIGGLVFSKETNRSEKTVLTVCSFPLAYAVFISGSRTSLIVMAVGLGFIAVFQKNVRNLVFLALVALPAWNLVSAYMSGRSIERFSSILDLSEIIDRNVVPLKVALTYFPDHLFGGGIGTSGYSVPYIFLGRYEYDDYFTADGDLGRLVIEFGIPGIIIFGNLLLVSLKSLRIYVNRLKDTQYGSVAMASGACFVMSIISFPSGSPFLGIPLGVMTWFFLGGLQKLYFLWEKESGKIEQPAKPKSFRKLPAQTMPTMPVKPNTEELKRKVRKRYSRPNSK